MSVRGVTYAFAVQRDCVSDRRPRLSAGDRPLKRVRSGELVLSVLGASDAKRKRVSFGPMLSPEQFNRELPPSTPIKKGTRLSSRTPLVQVGTSLHRQIRGDRPESKASHVCTRWVLLCLRLVRHLLFYVTFQLFSS